MFYSEAILNPSGDPFCDYFAVGFIVIGVTTHDAAAFSSSYVKAHHILLGVSRKLGIGDSFRLKFMPPRLAAGRIAVARTVDGGVLLKPARATWAAIATVVAAPAASRTGVKVKCAVIVHHILTVGR